MNCSRRGQLIRKLAASLLATGVFLLQGCASPDAATRAPVEDEDFRQVKRHCEEMALLAKRNAASNSQYPPFGSKSLYQSWQGWGRGEEGRPAYDMSFRECMRQHGY